MLIGLRKELRSCGKLAFRRIHSSPISPRAHSFTMRLHRFFLPLVCGFLAAAAFTAAAQEKTTLVFEGKRGPGKGANVVLLAGDEEYRSEEALPMLAKILSERHGFNCTVLF